MSIIVDNLLKKKFSSRYDDWKDDFNHKHPDRNINLILDPVDEIVSNMKSGAKSFVVYGEPQSGKTEMMIALCCRLFDENVKTIFVLMHDIKTLQIQNFQNRFVQNENFRVTPILVEEFLKTDERTRKTKNWLIFGRKNSVQLSKLIHETRMLSDKVILDDEADYATPDSNIGKKRKTDPTAINKKMKELIGDGQYIGVTATPGRLDLNNTLYNDADKWVYCSPDKGYTGVDYFFPEDPSEIDKNYTLTIHPSDKEYISYLQKAIYRFMARNAYLNVVEKKTGNYCMVIHTHYKKIQHEQDKATVQKIIDVLQGNNEDHTRKLLIKIHDETKKIFPNKEHQEKILEFIWKKAQSSTQLFTLNSDNDINNNIICLEAPSTFTFVFGGNTLSRGVTFNNMISFYFARSVKNALQQNTYVQIARHFGYRSNVGKQFELTLPEDIWEKWYQCFSCHEMSLDFAKSGKPIWIKHEFTNPVDGSSIDKQNVVLGSDGTISYGAFKVTKEIEELFCSKAYDNLTKLKKFNQIVGDECFPISAIKNIEDNIEPNQANKKIDIIVSKKNQGELRDLKNQKAMTEDERVLLRRKKSLAPSTSEKNLINAFCYIVPYKYSVTGMGRVHMTKNRSIKYYKNVKKDKLISHN